MTLYLGNCLDVLKTLSDGSIDSIVTDPPYELGFMGKSWDASGIANSVEMWGECLRVLKPGGHLLAFSGSRTYHRMTCAIEDAGFEIRDQIQWVYGNGFPKSLDVSKAIDKARTEDAGLNTREARPGVPLQASVTHEYDVRAANSDAARRWDGWGTALKPAHEPICVARKPLIGTVAANVLAHGAGALNIDACRVPTLDLLTGSGSLDQWRDMEGRADKLAASAGSVQHDAGRWPANLIHDDSPEVLAAFPQAPGQLADASTSSESRKTGRVYEASADRTYVGAGGTNFAMKPGARRPTTPAARFFYCAKVSKSERNFGLPDGITNDHPTLKPLALLAYLQRLVTPPGGVTLDPFMGSGSAGISAARGGFRYIGIEMEPEYFIVASLRVAHALHLGEPK